MIRKSQNLLIKCRTTDIKVSPLIVKSERWSFLIVLMLFLFCCPPVAAQCKVSLWLSKWKKLFSWNKDGFIPVFILMRTSCESVPHLFSRFSPELKSDTKRNLQEKTKLWFYGFTHKKKIQVFTVWELIFLDYRPLNVREMLKLNRKKLWKK